MEKPNRNDFNFSDHKIKGSEKLESSRTINIFCIVIFIILVFKCFPILGWFGVIASTVPAGLLGGMIGIGLKKIIAWILYRDDIKEYKRYLSEKAEFTNWDIRTRKEFWEKLDGYAFERELTSLLQKAGYKPKLTPGTGDHGVDIFLDDDTVIQCKAHKSPVTPGVVRELYGALHHFKAKRAILVSTGGFTTGVYEFIHGKPINLWGLEDLIRMQRNLENKNGIVKNDRKDDSGKPILITPRNRDNL